MFAYRCVLLEQDKQALVGNETHLLQFFHYICIQLNKLLPPGTKSEEQLTIKIEDYIRIFSLSHDFYLMLCKHLDPKGEKIAQEYPAMLVKFLLPKIKNLDDLCQGFKILIKVKWWNVLLDSINSKLNELALNRGETGRRGVAISIEDLQTDYRVSAYGILLKFFREFIPYLLSGGSKVNSVPAIGSMHKIDKLKIAPNSIDADLVAIIDNVGMAVLANLPNIYLAKPETDGQRLLHAYYSQTFRRDSRPEKLEYLKLDALSAMKEPVTTVLPYDFLRCTDENSKATLVFCSDLLHDRTEWHFVIQELREHYNIFVYDNPGVGLAHDVCAGPIDVQPIAQILFDLLFKKLAVKQVHIIGHGFGAYVALELFKKFKPPTKLILLNLPTNSLEATPRYQYNCLLQEMDEKEYCKRYCSLHYDKEESMQSMLIQEKIYKPVLNQHLLTQQLSYFVSYSQKVDIATMVWLNTTDVLLMWSEHNKLLPKNVKSIFPLSKCIKVTLPNVGHGVLDENFQLVLDQILLHIEGAKSYEKGAKPRRRSSLSTFSPMSAPREAGPAGPSGN